MPFSALLELCRSLRCWSDAVLCVVGVTPFSGIVGVTPFSGIVGVTAMTLLSLLRLVRSECSMQLCIRRDLSVTIWGECAVTPECSVRRV